MSKKFEKLIEYVINDEESKARELFHEIVVEKSREIYENLMQEEEMEGMQGNAAGQLITDVEMDEEGMTEEEDDFASETDVDMDADAADMDMDSMDMDADAADMDMDSMDMDADAGEIEDKVMDIDAKLDELLAKFEEVIGGEEADTDDDMDTDEEEEEVAEGEYSEEEEVMEAIALQKVSVDHGERLAGANGGGDKLSINSKSPNAENSGKGVTGSIAQPVKTKGADTNPDGTSAPSSAKPADAIRGLQNEAGKSMKAQGPATKPTLSQASGVNTKSPVKGIK